jgi:hypothetical protein
MESQSYQISYFRADGQCIDSTEIDELNEELIWDLFVEFGHERKEGDYYEVNN